MDITDPTLQLLAYELAAIFAILSIWLILKANKRSKKINEAASKAVKRLKRTKESRIESLSEILAEKYGLENEALSQTAVELQEREQQLYKLLLKVFVDSDSKSLVAFPTDLEKAIDACLTLLPVGITVDETPIDNTISSDNHVVDEKITEINSKLDLLISGSAVSSQIESVSVPESNDTVDIMEEVIIDEDDALAELLGGAGAENDFEIVLSEEESETSSSEEGNIEDVPSSDDIDDLLAGIDVELPEQVNDEEGGIDLSSFDEDTEVKKTETESGEATTDSVIEEQNSSDETIDDIDDLLASVEGIEEVTVDDVSLELGDEILQEAPPSLHSNKMSDYINGDWSNSTPDVYQKEIEGIQVEGDNLEFGAIIERDEIGRIEPEVVINNNDNIDSIVEEPADVTEDLDELLASVENEEDHVVEEPADVTKDLDELLASVESEEDSVVEEPADITEDLDELLASVESEEDRIVEEEPFDVTDDLDELLASVEREEASVVEEPADVTEDLDELLASVESEEDRVVEAPADITEDLDELLSSVESEEEAVPAALDELESENNEITVPISDEESDAPKVMSEDVSTVADGVSTEEEQLTALMAELADNINTETASEMEGSYLKDDLAPLPDEEKLDELLTDVWNLEAEDNEQSKVESIIEPLTVTELESEPVFVDANNALSNMVTTLIDKESPLPSESDLDDMLSEVRALEQNIALSRDGESDGKSSEQDKLKSILSGIPSFSSANK